MIDNKQVKEILLGLGADLCGIAGIDRFIDAPEGYHPTDVLPTCRSVISFGNCNACVNICPVNALEHLELKQQTCWNYAFGNDKTIQSWVISCHKCRDICPYNSGTENSFINKKTYWRTGNEI